MVSLYLERGANPPYENGVKVVGLVWAVRFVLGRGWVEEARGGGKVEEAAPL